ncbi:MAG: sulfatase [Pirellulales bacterium]|nr:sulfatase [Pirellulales bacterium]
MIPKIQMHPRHWQLFLIGWSLLGLLAGGGAVAASGEQPRPAPVALPRNILLFVADDLGLQLGCYGDQQAVTPHIDAFAQSGTRFTHAFCNTASCSPSRATILTGQHSHTHGMYGLAHNEHHFRLREGVSTLPALLRETGYYTGVVGKFHVEPAEVVRFNMINPVTGGNNDPVGLTNGFKKVMSNAAGKPFLAYVCTTDPHRPFANQREYDQVIPRKFDPVKLMVPRFLPDRQETRADLAEYYAAISRMDAAFGMIVDALTAAGHAEDTLILFLSDNGMPWPGAKTTLYDAGTHLPLIIRQPGHKLPGGTNNALVSWVDLLPTILEYAQVADLGRKLPPNLAGRSFFKILEESAPVGWDEWYGSHTFHEVTMYYPMRGMRTRQYKYIRNLAHQLPFPTAQDLYGSPTWQAALREEKSLYGERGLGEFLQRPAEELYDLQSDPHEARNLAGEPGQAPRLREMRQKVHAWQTATGDPWLIKDQHE